MRKITKYENKKVLVLGLAKSGVSAAKVLHQLGALVTVNDAKKFEENSEAQDLLSLGIRVITGSHPVELLDEEFSLLVKNPGIPYTNPIIEKAIEIGLKIITEVELAYEVAECPFIGITGTNGKTTTTTMIANILNQNRPFGLARLAGNIGFPASSVALLARPEDVLVTELSSFQLLGIDLFHPKTAVITNLYSAHLDYHGSRQAYVEAKWRIQKNMAATDHLVLNWDQMELRELSKCTKAAVIPFSTQAEVPGAYLKEGYLYYHSEKIMRQTDLLVPGLHNVENALAAIIVAKLNQVSNEDIALSLRQFKGVPHRTEFIGEFQHRQFYNDSKATNILATKMALSGFDKSRLILLAGGLDRGNEFDELVLDLKGIKGIVLFGETKQKLASAARKAGITQMIFSENVESAVAEAVKISENGDTILLSPACASWDQYPNFEVRGEKFAQAAKAMAL